MSVGEIGECLEHKECRPWAGAHPFPSTGGVEKQSRRYAGGIARDDLENFLGP